MITRVNPVECAKAVSVLTALGRPPTYRHMKINDDEDEKRRALNLQLEDLEEINPKTDAEADRIDDQIKELRKRLAKLNGDDDAGEETELPKPKAEPPDEIIKRPPKAERQDADFMQFPLALARLFDKRFELMENAIRYGVTNYARSLSQNSPSGLQRWTPKCEHPDYNHTDLKHRAIAKANRRN